MASDISSNISVKYVLPPSTDVTIRVIESREVYLKVDEGSAMLLFYSDDLSESDVRAGNSLLLRPETILLHCEEASVLTTTGLPAEISASVTSDSDNETRNLFKVIFGDESSQFILEMDTQLHISVGGECPRVKFKATDGTPEILGTPLELGKEYVFPEYTSTLINTFTERQYAINIEGKDQAINVLARTEKPLELMKVVKNLDLCREQACKAEVASGGKETGPNILVVGPPNSGKTSLSRFLVNKAVGSGWRPLFIDLEVRRNTNSRMCGVLTFVRVRQQHLLRGEMEGHKKQFFFGSTDPYDNLSLYIHQIKQIGLQVDRLFVSNKEKTRFSGVIVDICGLVSTNNDVIACILESMRIKYVFIIADDQYYEKMNPLFNYVDLEYIEKSRCIEERDEAKELNRRHKDLRKYFENTPESPMIMLDVGYDKVHIYSTVFQANTGAAAFTLIKIEDFPFRREEISALQLNTVMSVVKRGVGKPIDLLKAVERFVRLEGYDDENKIYRILSPVEVEKKSPEDSSDPIWIKGTIRVDFP